MIIIASIAFSVFSLFGSGTENVNFDNQKPGGFPAGWSQGETHRGPPPHWEVRQDPTAPSRPNVLTQVSRTGGPYEFSLAIFDRPTCRDGDLSVKFKISPESGLVKTAGLIWRYQDERNYYLLHFSVDEKNIVLFRVQNGKAQAIPVVGGKPGGFGVAHDLRPGQWYIAKVIFRGSHFRVLFGNRRLFDAVDDGIAVGGKTGVWTKASTVASFDDFRVDKKG